MNNNAPWILFDMDDVLVNLRDAIQVAMEKKTNRDIPWKAWNVYELHHIYGISNNDCMSAFLEHAILENATLEPGALETIEKARNNGFKTGILTARGWHPDGEGLTQRWLDQWHVVVDKLVLVPLGSNKGDMLSEFGSVHLFVDDHVKNLEDIQRTGKVDHILLRDRPWNKNRHDWPRINHLAELECWIEPLTASLPFEP